MVEKRLPNDLRELALAALAKTKGSTPMIKVIEVIKIGRKPFAAGIAADSKISCPTAR